MITDKVKTSFSQNMNIPPCSFMLCTNDFEKQFMMMNESKIDLKGTALNEDCA